MNTLPPIPPLLGQDLLRDDPRLAEVRRSWRLNNQSGREALGDYRETLGKSHLQGVDLPEPLLRVEQLTNDLNSSITLLRLLLDTGPAITIDTLNDQLQRISGERLPVSLDSHAALDARIGELTRQRADLADRFKPVQNTMDLLQTEMSSCLRQFASACHQATPGAMPMAMQTAIYTALPIHLANLAIETKALAETLPPETIGAADIESRSLRYCRAVLLPRIDALTTLLQVNAPTMISHWPGNEGVGHYRLIEPRGGQPLNIAPETTVSSVVSHGAEQSNVISLAAMREKLAGDASKKR